MISRRFLDIRSWGGVSWMFDYIVIPFLSAQYRVAHEEIVDEYSSKNYSQNVHDEKHSVELGRSWKMNIITDYPNFE